MQKTDTGSHSSIYDKCDIKYTDKEKVIVENKIVKEIIEIGEKEDEKESNSCNS